MTGQEPVKTKGYVNVCQIILLSIQLLKMCHKQSMYATGARGDNSVPNFWDAKQQTSGNDLLFKSKIEHYRIIHMVIHIYI